jgi:hypothetical protein
MKKRVIATASIGHHEELSSLAQSNLEKYAELHGYDISNCRNTLDSTRPPAWSKVLLILELMKSYEEIFWIDADAIILNDTADISSIVKEDSDLGWVYHEYENQSSPNSGVMFIRVNARTKRLFELANEQRDLDHHPWWEQAALMRLIGIETNVWPIGGINSTGLVAITEQKLPKEWNSIRQDPAVPARIRHFAGEHFWVRKLLMAEYANPTGTSAETLDEVINKINETKESNESLRQQNESLRQQNESLHQQNESLHQQNESLHQQNESLSQYNLEITNSRTWKLFSLWRFIRNSH